jgi:ribosome maturation factor RimP
MISKKIIEGLIAERIAELDNGLFVVELTISSKNEINVEIDKHEGNVSVSDCMAVSRNIEHNLDREEQDFEVHVSSAGLDRPLRILPQYIKNIGRSVECAMVDGSKLEGLLLGASDQDITIENSRTEKLEGKKKKELITEELVIPLKTIKETKIVISFK